MIKNLARLVVVLSALPCALTARGQTSRIFSGPDDVPGVEYNAAVNLTTKNVKVAGTIFVPDGAPRLRAVIVLVERGPRNDLAAQGRFNDQSWRRLSQTCECGLLYLRLDTIHAIPDDTSAANDPLRNAPVGGSEALIQLLPRLGDESARRDLKDAPLIFWGWSSAASFGTTFAEQYPERTAAFIRYHTHLRGLPVNMKALRNIPALLIAGGKDETAGTEDAAALFKKGRSAGAPWTFAIEPEATHGSSEETFLETGRQLIIPWVVAVLRLRLGPDAARLRPVTDAAAWFGDSQTAEIAQPRIFRGSKLEASWLPDEVTALGWRDVIHTAK